MRKFKAFRIFEDSDAVAGRIVEMDIDSLDKGDILIQVKYSSVNYKDALAATGTGRIIRRFPCNGGIDLAGIVIESEDPSYKSGDEVIATSYGIGVDHDGGYSELARIPSKWVLPMPSGMSMYESMCFGTAGLTAAMAVQRLEGNGVSPHSGPVVVTGATGGVGSIAIDILSGQGFDVTALTGKRDEEEYLKSLGAKEVLYRQDLNLEKIKPLGKEIWAGAIDNLGGEVLSLITTQMQWGGAVSVIGLASSSKFNVTVLPFILRNVSVLGIDSVNAPFEVRKESWIRLASRYKPKNIDTAVSIISLEDLNDTFTTMMEGRIKGRKVVKFD